MKRIPLGGLPSLCANNLAMPAMSSPIISGPTKGTFWSGGAITGGAGGGGGGGGPAIGGGGGAIGGGGGGIDGGGGSGGIPGPRPIGGPIIGGGITGGGGVGASATLSATESGIGGTMASSIGSSATVISGIASCLDRSNLLSILPGIPSRPYIPSISLGSTAGA